MGSRNFNKKAMQRKIYTKKNPNIAKQQPEVHHLHPLLQVVKPAWTMKWKFMSRDWQRSCRRNGRQVTRESSDMSEQDFRFA